MKGRNSIRLGSVERLAIRMVLGITCLCFSACAARIGVKVGDIPSPVLPSIVERHSAESFVAAHIEEGGYKEIKSGEAAERVRRVVDRISIAANIPAGTFPTHVVEAGDEVNAMAVNSASIVVYRKLLDRVRSDDELAVVLAHEVAHILGRHSQEQGKSERASLVSVGSSILGSIASVAAAYAGAGSAGANLAGDLTSDATGLIGYGALVGRFDREQEYEADHVGLMLMAKAGYDPKVALQFWERSEEVFGSTNTKIGAFFSTHPASSDRVDALTDALPLSEQHYQTTKALHEHTAAMKKAPAAPIRKVNKKQARTQP